MQQTASPGNELFLGPVHTNFDGVDSVIFVFLQGFASDMCLLHMSLR